MITIKKIYLILTLSISLIFIACPTETANLTDDPNLTSDKKVNIITEKGKRQIPKEAGSTIKITLKYDSKNGETIKYNFNNGVDNNSFSYLKPFLVSDKTLINVAAFKDGKIIDETKNSIQIYKIEHVFDTKDELAKYIKEQIPKRKLDGDYNDIGLGKIKDLSNLFDSDFPMNFGGKFNGDISAWDTSNVANMESMFNGATSFNQPLNFDTSNVTNMRYMFKGATSFNQPLNFDTKKVIDMRYMFKAATSFNQPLNFDTSNVENMESLFNGAISFNQPLNFDTSNVTTMLYMFRGATSFNQPLKFNTKKVKNMESMFERATSFNQPLNFDTSNVINMRYMFSEATIFNQPLNFDTSNVELMIYMFKNATIFNQPLNFDTSKVTNMDSMFSGAKLFDQDLSNWNPIKVTDMNSMFENSGYAHSLLAWEDKLLDGVSHYNINKNTPTLKNSMLPSKLR